MTDKIMERVKTFVKWGLIRRLYRYLSLVLPDSLFLRCQYKRRMKKKLNLTNPHSFNEKIQWLKLNWRNDLCRICADKYEVRKYVQKRLGSGLLNELYAVYDRIEEIKIASLPQAFVLKTTHGCGQNIICRNKEDMDWQKNFRLLKYYLQNNHYYFGREWAYKGIVPRIICEKYLEENGEIPKDYKIFCFNGIPRIIQVDFERFTSHKRNLYDLNWNLLGVTYKYPSSKEALVKPEGLFEMLEYARVLSAKIPFVRVDFYHINGKIIFGEMTFYPANGTGRFDPDKYDVILGAYLELPGC